jgi:lysophospholipase L1-like esterase
MRSSMRLRLAFAWLALVPGLAAGQTSAAVSRPPHIVLVGDSTVTEGSGWGLGFRDFVTGGATVTNTAQNGRSSKSFRDEGHWAPALALKGDYYLIQFGHNDQPGKGPERETDPSTTFPANMTRYVDEVRAIGATPILVTSLVRRTFSQAEPSKLTSSLGPWVDAVTRVAMEKHVPLIDLAASSRELCERLGPVQTARFNIKKDDGTWDTTHLDAAGSAVFARLVVDDLRRLVPALAPFLKAEPATVDLIEGPPDLPPPHPLLGLPDARGERRLPFGRVYTRSIRLARFAQREAFNGRQPDQAQLPPIMTSPVIVAAWEFVPQTPPDGIVDCGTSVACAGSPCSIPRGWPTIARASL